MSVSLDATVEVRAGVALVTARVVNPTPVARGVRLRNCLDGPVLPPRRHGVPAEGWSETGFEGTVPAEGTLPLGYACPLDDDVAAEPPAELASVGAPRSDSGSPAERTHRALAPARPPRDAVPHPDAEPAHAEGNDWNATDGDDPTLDGATPDRAPESNRSLPASDADGASAPDPVDAYLDVVERRISLGERLTDASVAEATAALSEADPAAVCIPALPTTLAADADALEAFAERAERLAGRARATAVPVDALARLS